MYRILFLASLLGFISCSDSSQNNDVREDNGMVSDTLYITEEMRGHIGFTFNFDTLTITKRIPRDTWISVRVKGRDDMIELLKNSNLYLKSKDSNFQIQRLSNNEYKFFVSSAYSGYIFTYDTIEKQENLEIYTHLQPHNGFFLKTYWLDKPITYPEMTNVLLRYELLGDRN